MCWISGGIDIACDLAETKIIGFSDINLFDLIKKFNYFNPSEERLVLAVLRNLFTKK